MSESFSVIKNTAIDWYHTLISLFIYNLFFVGLSMTIVLMPPALVALYYVTSETAAGRATEFMDFFRYGLRYALRSYAWALVNIVVFIIVWVAMTFYGQWNNVLTMMLSAIILVVGLYWGVIQLYFWPYIFRQEEPNMRQALRNAFLTAATSPMFTLVIMLVSVILMGLSVLLLFPLAFGVVAFVALLGNHAVRNRIEYFKAVQQ